MSLFARTSCLEAHGEVSIEVCVAGIRQHIRM